MKHFFVTIWCISTSLLSAASPQVFQLWPATPPGPVAKVEGAERDLTKPDDKLIAGRIIIKLGHVSTPQMHVYLPEKANGGAVLVCPGGGFSILAWDLEGTEVAEWLNSLGFAAIVVKYRVPTREHGDTLNKQVNTPLKAVGPVIDAQRAMSLTRSKAVEWGLDPQRIGIMGFSAGGETAGLTAILRDERLYPKVDAADEHSCAPNFALPIYPGGFYDNEFMHSVQDVEQRIKRAAKEERLEGWRPSLTKPDMPRPPAELPQDVREHMRLMCDLLLLAWQMDKTRVATLIFNRDVSHMKFGFLDGVLNDQLHGISHHKEDAAKLAGYQRINQFHVEQLAYLMSRMKQVDEGNGTSMLDNVILQFGSNMFNGDSHDGRNLPMILAGHGGGSIAGGRVLDLSSKTEEQQRACNLYLTIAQRMGVKLDRFGDSVEMLGGLS
jgi:acetyl esterase/lipase